MEEIMITAEEHDRLISAGYCMFVLLAPRYIKREYSLDLKNFTHEDLKIEIEYYLKTAKCLEDSFSYIFDIVNHALEPEDIIKFGLTADFYRGIFAEMGYDLEQKAPYPSRNGFQVVR